MRKWQKIVLAVIAVLALTLIAALLLVRSFTDEAQLKARVYAELKQASTAEVRLGELELSLFPIPKLQVHDVELLNPSWKSEQAHTQMIVRAETIRADIALMPLLRGKFEVKGVTLKGAQINLETDAKGKHNWDVIRAHTPVSDLPNFSLGSIQKNALRAVLIKDSTVRVVDATQTVRIWHVKQLALSAGHDLRDLQLNASLIHNQHQLDLDGTINDLSQLGQAGASSQSSFKLKIGQAQAHIDGVLPLDRALTNSNLHITIDAPSLKDAYAFLEMPHQSTAALKAALQLHTSKQEITLKNMKVQLGELHATANARVDRLAAKPRFDLNVQADKVDMVQTLLDAGRPPRPPKPPGQLLYDHPLPWPWLVKMQGTEGKLDLSIAALRLRSGIMVSDAHAQAEVVDQRMVVKAFDGKLLQGTVHGDAIFEAKDKAVKLNLRMEDALLGEWLRQGGKKLKVDGGKMNVDAQVSTHGNSMKELAASISGPVDIRIADAAIHSSKAGNAEFWLTGLFSTKDDTHINMSCASAHLPFRSGLAKGSAIVGARSDVSQLLTSGYIDMRKQTLDLHGRVRARSGVSLGLSNIAGDVKIVGKLTKPELNLDEAGIVGAIARVGAAILTSGVSLIATSIWDGANPESDPCQIVFAAKARQQDKAAHEKDDVE